MFMAGAQSHSITQKLLCPTCGSSLWLPLHGQHTHYDTVTYLLSDTHIHKPIATRPPSLTHVHSHTHIFATQTHMLTVTHSQQPSHPHAHPLL